MIKYFGITIIICLWSLSINAQSFCQTPALRQPSENKVTPLPSRSSSDSQYILKVYFHVLRSSNGTGGVNSSIVQSAYNLLNDDFNTDNIFFLWDGVVDYIDNSSIYMNPSSSIFSNNNHQDGIDIYIYPTSLTNGGGKANGFGSGTELYLTGNYNGVSYAATHVVSHEMGHVLNLYHTHHGTCYEGGGDPNQCAELVNGVNSDVCGDYVEDTPADPGIFQNVTSSCTWVYQGVYYDSNNHAYNPDTHLIMSYTKPNCMEYFSPMQAQRMKEAINNFTVLQNTLITITGFSLLYNSAIYSLVNLQSAFSVEWSLSGTNASCFTLQNNSPTTNQCTITRKSNSVFNGSTSLVLTAQIQYNGTTVKTITKNIEAPYIVGTSIPCNVENYTVGSLPTGHTVTWSLSGTGLTETPILPGDPHYSLIDSSNNYYRVTRTALAYAKGTITATISNGSNTVASLTKVIDTGINFSGTWHQGSNSSSSLVSGQSYTIESGQQITLQSSDFIGANISYTKSNMLVLQWNNNNGTITFRPVISIGANHGSVTVTGYNSSTCEAFRFVFTYYSAPQPFTLNVNAVGNNYIFSLQEKQTREDGTETVRTVEDGEQPWKLSIVQYSSGNTIYEGSSNGAPIPLNTSGWKSGLYIAVAKIEEQIFALKFGVK